MSEELLQWGMFNKNIICIIVFICIIQLYFETDLRLSIIYKDDIHYVYN